MKKILTIMSVVLSLLSFNVTAGKMSEGDYVVIILDCFQCSVCVFLPLIVFSN
jgi:hypothetical protein